jgi:hypothetical protein
MEDEPHSWTSAVGLFQPISPFSGVAKKELAELDHRVLVSLRPFLG